MKKWICLFAVLFYIVFWPVSSLAQSVTSAGDFWAQNELVDAEALSLCPANCENRLRAPLSQSDHAFIQTAVYHKLAEIAIDSPSAAFSPSTISLTRQSFVESLFSQLKTLSFTSPIAGTNETAIEFALRCHILVGNEKKDLQLNKPCSLQQALLIAARFVRTVYTLTGESSQGFVWKATNGSHTLYLIGTVHTNLVYPLSSRLTDIIRSSQHVAFEVNFNNKSEYNYLKNLEHYSDGTTLKNHLSPLTYQKVISQLQQEGYTEREIAACKPWSLAMMLNNLCALTDDVPTVDEYLFQKSLALNKTISECEGYQYQGDLYNSLSDSYQENYLLTALGNYKDYLTNGRDSNIWIDNETNALAFQHGTISVFEATYDKDALLSSHDELTELLYVDRDTNMTNYAEQLLCNPNISTAAFVVGAGHMIGQHSIIDSLMDRGYEVSYIS